MSIETLYLWLAERDIMLVFAAEHTEYDDETEVIYLSSYDDETEEYHSLLHEIGHYLIQTADDYNVEYADKLRSKSRHEYVRGFLREEREAWRLGLELAEGMALPVDTAAYSALACECVEQYAEAFRKVL